MIIGVTASSRALTASVSYQVINGYIATTSPGFCAGITSGITVYNSTYTTFSNAFNNSSLIYSDTGLNLLASAGFYGDTSGGGGQTNYEWNGTNWVVYNVC